jgi:hypothetical protein
MKLGHFAAVVAAFTVSFAATISTAERVLASEQPERSLVGAPTLSPFQVPLLFVIDGVKYERGQIPVIARDQIFAMRVIKGRAALEKYGPDASYGVVVIITRRAVIPQA